MKRQIEPCFSHGCGHDHGRGHGIGAIAAAAGARLAVRCSRIRHMPPMILWVTLCFRRN